MLSAVVPRATTSTATSETGTPREAATAEKTPSSEGVATTPSTRTKDTATPSNAVLAGTGLTLTAATLLLMTAKKYGAWTKAWYGRIVQPAF